MGDYADPYEVAEKLNPSAPSAPYADPFEAATKASQISQQPLPKPKAEEPSSFDARAGLEAGAGAAGLYGAASAGTRAVNAMLGNWDPEKAGAMAMRQKLAEVGISTRIGDLTGLPGPAKAAGFSPMWRGLENMTQQYIPFSGADKVVKQQADALKAATTSGGDVADKSIDAIRNAWQAREGQVDDLAKALDQSNTSGTVKLDNTIRGLKNFTKQYGPEKLLALPDKPAAARLLMFAGYPDEAAKALDHWNDRAAATYLNNSLAQMQQGTSFDNFRDLQKSIGQAIGHFSGDIGKPTPPEQGAMKGIYARMYGDLDQFGQQAQGNTDFMKDFKNFMGEYKATQGFYDNNPFLRNVVKGGYDMQGTKFLQDFTNPANYQKVSPLAPYVQPSDMAAFYGPQIADRGTDQLVRELTKEPSPGIPWKKVGELAAAATASNAGPSIYGGWQAASHINPLAVAAGVAAQTAAARGINSTSVAPRLWGAANPIGLQPISESPVLGALKRILGHARP